MGTVPFCAGHHRRGGRGAKGDCPPLCVGLNFAAVSTAANPEPGYSKSIQRNAQSLGKPTAPRPKVNAPKVFRRLHLSNAN